MTYKTPWPSDLIRLMAAPKPTITDEDELEEAQAASGGCAHTLYLWAKSIRDGYQGTYFRLWETNWRRRLETEQEP